MTDHAPQPAPRRILVVEDDPAITTGLSINMRYEGFAVEVARDGRSGLDKALKAYALFFHESF